MIVLDTNVVSELMRNSPQAEVIEWLDRRVRSTLFISAVTQAEILRGIAILPTGGRQQDLAAAAENTLDVLFSGRILPFDSNAARAYAIIFATRRAAGRPISHLDCQIAATARSMGASIATRDMGGFEACGIEVTNPWSTQ